jgi:hypothetical protein
MVTPATSPLALQFELDLHALHAVEAVAALAHRLRLLEQLPHPVPPERLPSALRVIVGRGRHSSGEEVRHLPLALLCGTCGHGIRRLPCT